MSAPTNPKATPRSSERFKEAVAQLLPHVLFTFFVEDIVAQPCLRQGGTLAVRRGFLRAAINREPETGVAQIPFCRE